MRKKSRAVLRRSGHKLPPLALVSLRVQPETWARCAWAAAAKGLKRNEFVRATLADATRDAKPPNDADCRGLGTPGEQTEWARVAKRYGMSVGAFVVWATNKAAERLKAAAKQDEIDQSLRRTQPKRRSVLDG
jgi:hypothetical protein